jgi:hypothetical protein
VDGKSEEPEKPLLPRQSIAYNSLSVVIDSDIANVSISGAPTAVPAEGAGLSAAERFISYVGRNKE